MSNAPSKKTAAETARLLDINSFKPELIISKTVSQQIQKLCSKFASVEWSGVLYHRTEGNYSDPSTFKLYAEYILLMDVGSSAYTAYSFNDPSFVQALSEKPELMELKMGHIHSHNNMAVFFSGTDNDELLDNAPNYNYYLSLIVNNKNEMTAKIAIPATIISGERRISYVDVEGTTIEQVLDAENDKSIIWCYTLDIKSEDRFELDDFFSQRVLDFDKKPRTTVSYGVGFHQNSNSNVGRTTPANGRFPSFSDTPKLIESTKEFRKLLNSKKVEKAFATKIVNPTGLLGNMKCNFSVDAANSEMASFHTSTNFLKFYLRPIISVLGDKEYDEFDSEISSNYLKDLSSFIPNDDSEDLLYRFLDNDWGFGKAVTAFSKAVKFKDDRGNNIALLQGVSDFLNNNQMIRQTHLPAVNVLNKIIEDEAVTYGLNVVKSGDKILLLSVQEEIEMARAQVLVPDPGYNYHNYMD